MFGSNFIGGSNSGAYVPTALNVSNGTLVSGTWPTIPGQPIAQLPASAPGAIPYNTAAYDQIVRPSSSGTYYVDLDASLVATDKLTFTAQVGFTHAVGDTPQETDIESQGGNGVSYQLNGINNPVSVNYPGLNTASPAQFFTDYASGSITHSVDVKETHGTDRWTVGCRLVVPSVSQIWRHGATPRTERQSFQSHPEKNGCPDCSATGPNPAFDGGAVLSNCTPTDSGGSGYPV